MSVTFGQQFYQRQLDFLVAKEADGLVESQYAEDGEIVSFDFTVKGHEALKNHFRGYLDMLGYIKVLSTDKFAESENTIFFEATVETQLGVAQVYDAFVLQDGKVIHHITGVK
ncbi:MAG: nuclear transport factor 2 family protein [Caldilineaceae bacterium]|nr:nuclear transport factor 2 family protein [Caldilineaceae bacterium]